MQAPGGPPGLYGDPGMPGQDPGMSMQDYDDMGGLPPDAGGAGGFAPPGQGGFDGDPYGDMGMGGPPPPGMPQQGGPGAAANGPPEDFGPFTRPVFNKLVRAYSALSSLVALILHFMVLGQGVKSYMRSAQSLRNTADEKEETKKADKPTKTTKSKRRSSTTSETLLGRRAVSTDSHSPDPARPTPAPGPTLKTRSVTRRALVIRQNNAARSAEAVSAPNYVPDSDVPMRDGAVGFTASSHLFAAFVILLLFWLEWLLFMRKPTLFSYWGPLIIAVIQLYMAFDILGRSLNAANQAGGYVLLLMAVVNMFFAGWTVLQARKLRGMQPMQTMQQQQPMMGEAPFMADQMPPGPPFDDGGFDEGQFDEGQPPPLDPGQEGMPPIEGMPPDGEPMEDEDESPRSPRRSRRKKKSKRRSSRGSYESDDLESCCDSYLPPPVPRRHSYSYGQEYIPPPQLAPVADFVPSTPISLYGPQEYQRRLENRRRARSRSLSQPVMQFDPNTGQYITPAGNSNARTTQMLPNVQEEEEEDVTMQAAQRVTDPNMRQGGFANRTRVWKRLQNDSGLIL
ncbi:hypothetical protein P389DRAFT_69682 [Cystobasidium minutum MCA 4210]|uniref:uncharacterized protein n=1 Tax=Cystobasidium minutum MCA 4210 TaxID=1397322 RepID=UPI0034CECB56|eukprot:jgi/Rhomi1/69682/CE69681_480